MVICINGIFGISGTKNYCQIENAVKSFPREIEHVLTNDERKEWSFWRTLHLFFAAKTDRKVCLQWPPAVPQLFVLHGLLATMRNSMAFQNHSHSENKWHHSNSGKYNFITKSVETQLFKSYFVFRSRIPNTTLSLGAMVVQTNQVYATQKEEPYCLVQEGHLIFLKA